MPDKLTTQVHIFSRPTGFANSCSTNNISTKLAGPDYEEDIIDYSEQIKLTYMQDSGAPRQSRGAPQASMFVSWICKE